MEDDDSPAETTPEVATPVKRGRGRPKKVTTTAVQKGGVKNKSPKLSIAQRRNFALDLNLSPTPTNQGKTPPTPQTPSKKKVSRYTTRAVKMTAGSVLYQNEVKANPQQANTISCRGRLFMGSNDTSQDPIKGQRLFFNLGQNLYLDKQPDKTEVGAGCLRLSLWKTNAIDKMQRVGARYSISLNFDAIHQIRKESEDIKLSLSLTDNENFMGYFLSLGHMLYVTVEPDYCCVSLRKWYKPLHCQGDPEGDLLPSREGIRLSYEQFKRFVEFLDSQLVTEFPSYDAHVFCCEKPQHSPADCTLCNPKGLLPMQKEFKRLLDVW